MEVAKTQNLLRKQSDYFEQLSPKAKAIHAQLMDQEQIITSHTRSFDQQAALLRLKSGTLLNAFKEAVNEGKRKGYFETVVGALFKDEQGNKTIGKTTRCQRMKVARLQDADEYLHLGWEKLVSISVVADDKYKTIATFLKGMGCNPDSHEELSSDEFEIALKTAKATHLMKKNRVKQVDKEVVEAAVRRDIQFDKKLLKKLSGSKRPDQVLRSRTQYDVSQAPKYSKAEVPNLGKIEMIMQELFKLLEHTNRRIDKKGILKHIPGYIYEDLAHELGIAFSKAGYDGGKFYEDVSIIHDL